MDTVKHMDPGATRFFTSAVHEFAPEARNAWVTIDAGLHGDNDTYVLVTAASTG